MRSTPAPLGASSEVNSAGMRQDLLFRQDSGTRRTRGSRPPQQQQRQDLGGWAAAQGRCSGRALKAALLHVRALFNLTRTCLNPAPLLLTRNSSNRTAACMTLQLLILQPFCSGASACSHPATLHPD